MHGRNATDAQADARTWRDTTNPTGPGALPGEPEPPPEHEHEHPSEGSDHPADEEQLNAELVEGGPTAGPGGGGATQSPDGAKHTEAIARRAVPRG